MGEITVQDQGHGKSLSSQKWVRHPLEWHTFRSMSIGPPNPEVGIFLILTLKYWVQHPIDSHPFKPMSISPPIPEIQLFWPWKSRAKIRSRSPLGQHPIDSHPFNFLSSAVPFLGYRYSNIWPWKCKLLDQGWGQNSGSHSKSNNILSTRIPCVPCIPPSSSRSKSIPYARTHFREKGGNFSKVGAKSRKRGNFSGINRRNF